MRFDLFVLPFTIGVAYFLLQLIIRYSNWIYSIPLKDKYKIGRSIFSLRTLSAFKEIIAESLLHISIFKRNKLLGYMHMSLALGWFLLIIGGALESRYYSGTHLNPPYYPIFFKFFLAQEHAFPFETYSLPNFFHIMMDALLLFVLSGVVLAWVKRKKKKWFGMHKTTSHSTFDKVAITALWFIFPLRLLAESFTCAETGLGSFLTNSVGNFLNLFLPASALAYPFWWLYSIALCVFLIALPFSRYMHIFTEVLFIFFKNWGIKTRKTVSGFEKMQIYSCSRCGLCVDACPIYANSQEKDVIPAYFFRDYRAKRNITRVKQIISKTAFECLECGKCQEVCPVHIEVNNVRTAVRAQVTNKYPLQYAFPNPKTSRKPDVIYFAGCMGHLTPAVKQAVEGILRHAKVNYHFLDKNGSICCGRPMSLAGQYKAAQDLMMKNKEMILHLEAKTLVTSCPICYKIFKEEYRLSLEILHHSEYFSRLLDEKKITLKTASNSAIAYHDPCELGRGTRVFEAPRKVLQQVGTVVESEEHAENSICCGGSVGSIGLASQTKRDITLQALHKLTVSQPDCVATACPLCKKTFAKLSPVPVKDIAELLYEKLEIIEEPVGKKYVVEHL